MKSTMYPGSFDPITNGHLDIIERACGLFDKVYICIAENPGKKYYFSKEERINFVKDAVKKFSNAEVVYTDGLVIKKAEELGCICIIRGLRAVTDFEFEFQLNACNEYIDKKIDTIFLMSSNGKGFISSSNVKDLATNGIDVKDLVPESVYKAFKNKIR